MSLLQQLTEYLSQPPDSIVYHVVTLLALQITLGLAWWQLRRRSEDELARRLLWASAAILLSRLLILLALMATSGQMDAVVLLPPLERAIDAVTVAILVWLLAPRPKGLPHLGNALLLIVIILIAFLYTVFAGEWREVLADGVSYAATQQSVAWAVLQIVLLAAGVILVTYARESQWALRFVLLIALFAASGATLLFGADIGPPEVEAPLWTRLGNVIAFPMLAALAYRHNLQNAFSIANQPEGSSSLRLIQSLGLSAGVVSTLQPDKALEAAVEMAAQLVPARLVAIARINDERPERLDMLVSTTEPVTGELDAPATVRIVTARRSQLTALARTSSSGQQLELRSSGLGARQYHELKQALKLEQDGLMLIQPLFAGGKEIGLLLLARGSTPEAWSEDEKALVIALGPFLASALHNAKRHQLALAGQAPDFDHALAKIKADLEQVGRQRDEATQKATQLSRQLDIARERLEVDNRKLRETTQALALAVQRQAEVSQLEEELLGLREALSEAELALAHAAAGKVGLSTEWVMRTVTRYSGELEEAQTQIRALEERLNQSDGQELLAHAASVMGRLRTPLTALGGYTDLMLERAAGDLSAKQDSLLRRMRVNVDNMTRTVDALSMAARSAPITQSGDAQINVHEAFEEAIYTISGELQSKKLRVDMMLEDGLPALADSANNLSELLTTLLRAACLATEPDGRLHISGRRIPNEQRTGDDSEQAGYLRVSIGDDGGERSHEVYARTILERSASAGPHPSTEVKELSSLLDSASLLASARGGRSWLDLAHPKGSCLILLLPFPADTAGISD